jgi:serine/threonine protein kinase
MARYELVERIGVGGMAEIYRGKAIAGGGFEKLVAIKRILPHLSQDKRFVELLITEAKTLSRLRHRNIVQIYDVGLGDDSQYFLVMEYVEGMDLGALYESLEHRGRRLPLDVAIYIAGEVCEALEHAHHSRGEDGELLRLVHRDVSPSNVLLSVSGEVKLTDFGIAKRTEEATGHGGVRGKFAYISPEQAHNKHVDGRSDVFSVGIVLYELVTGRRLYSHLPDFDALRAVREGRTPRPREVAPEVDAELERILQTALEARPEGRFASAAEFAMQLRNYRYSLPSVAADPAVEISRLIAEHAAAEPDSADEGPEPSFVRIKSVAGFSGSFDLSELSSADGGESASDSFTADFSVVRELPDRPEDEDTRAVRVAGGQIVDDAETHVAPDLGLSPTPEPSGELDLSDVETSVRRPDDLLSRIGEAAPVSVNREPTSTMGRLRRSGALRDDSLGPDAAPPSRSDAPSRPSTMGPPILSARMTRRRRRILMIAISAAVLLAIVALAVAGAMLGGGENQAGEVDAGVAAPATAAPAAPTADAGPDKTPTKRRHKHTTHKHDRRHSH